MSWNSSRSLRKERSSTGSAVVGCMSGMLHFFDFHGVSFLRHHDHLHDQSPLPLLPPLIQDHHPNYNTSTPAAPPGIEAPRNSLENAPPQPVFQEEIIREVFVEEITGEEIPMGFEIYGESARRRSEDLSNRSKNSPGVVARLMGLEILPDSEDSGVVDTRKQAYGLRRNVAGNGRNSNSGKFKEAAVEGDHQLIRSVLKRRCENVGRTECRSLPVSPRVSSARWSDVGPPRLSLQIQKENIPPPFVNYNYVDANPPPPACSSSSSSSPASYHSLKSIDTKKTNYKGANSSTGTSPKLAPAFSPRTPPLNPKRDDKIPNRSPQLRSESSSPARTTSSVRLDVQTKPKSPKSPILRPMTQEVPPKSGCRVPLAPKPPENIEKPKVVYEKRKEAAMRIRENYVRSVVEKSVSVGSGGRVAGGGGGGRKGLRKPISDSLVKVNVITKSNLDQVMEMKYPKHQTQYYQEGKCRTVDTSGFVPLPRNKNLRLLPSPAVLSDSANKTKPTSTIPPNPLVVNSNRVIDKAIILQPTSQRIPRPNTTNTTITSSCTTNGALVKPTNHLTVITKNSDSDSLISLFSYIKSIFETAGVKPTSRTVNFTHWYSPAHPLDPAIFTQLESPNHNCRRRSVQTQICYYESLLPDGCKLRFPSYRRFIFDLIDELLRERLRPHLSARPWRLKAASPIRGITGKELLDGVWRDVAAFPNADCKIVEDIDALIAGDVSTGHFSSALNDVVGRDVDAEMVLVEIGREIADLLVEEVLLDLQHEFLVFNLHSSSRS